MPKRPIHFYYTQDREAAKEFLEQSNAVETSCLQTDTSIRTVYEISTPNGTEIWIEWESRLEPPEYFYQLKNLD